MLQLQRSHTIPWIVSVTWKPECSRHDRMDKPAAENTCTQLKWYITPHTLHSPNTFLPREGWAAVKSSFQRQNLHWLCGKSPNIYDQQNKNTLNTPKLDSQSVVYLVTKRHQSRYWRTIGSDLATTSGEHKLRNASGCPWWEHLTSENDVPATSETDVITLFMKHRGSLLTKQLELIIVTRKRWQFPDLNARAWLFASHCTEYDLNLHRNTHGQLISQYRIVLYWLSISYFYCGLIFKL